MSISEAKLAANRANAQLSTGATTEAGKAKVSLNAVKTALTGRTVLLPTDDVAAYEATIARYSKKWQPETEEERVLVQDLADNEWRRNRLPTLESAVWALGYREVSDEFATEPDPTLRRTLIEGRIFIVYQRQLMNLQLQDSRLTRRRDKDEERLYKVQGDRRYLTAKRAQAEAQAKPASSAVSKDGFEFSNASPAPAAPVKTAPVPAPVPASPRTATSSMLLPKGLSGFDFSHLTREELDRAEKQMEEEFRNSGARIDAEVAAIRAESKAKVAAQFASAHQKKVA